MAEKKNIQPGQFWIVENDALACVQGLNSEGSAWLVARFNTRGWTSRVGIRECNFVRKLSPEEAREFGALFFEREAKALKEEYESKLASLNSSFNDLFND